MIPASALCLVDAVGIKGLRPGRGAPVDNRIMVNALLRVPQAVRRPGGRYDDPITVRQLPNFAAKKPASMAPYGRLAGCVPLSRAPCPFRIRQDQ